MFCSEKTYPSYIVYPTAKFYNNEDAIGCAIAESGIPREELFLCSKVWPADLGSEWTLKSFEESCAKLKTTYLDMYLIHWPKEDPKDPDWFSKVAESWKVMEDLYLEGRIRAIGLSNFLPHHIKPLLDVARIRPMVDQLELHVGYMQEFTLKYLKQEKIMAQAWSPLGRARVINDERITKVAAKYGVSNAKLLLKYLVQRGIPVIPKASSIERMRENKDIFGFEITWEDISFLSCLPEFGYSGEHPDF